MDTSDDEFAAAFQQMKELHPTSDEELIKAVLTMAFEQRKAAGSNAPAATSTFAQQKAFPMPTTRLAQRSGVRVHDSVLTSGPREAPGARCIQCGEEILIVYPAHPTLHAACVSKHDAKEAPTKPDAKKVDKCALCGRELLFKYDAHPQHHVLCWSKLEEWQRSKFTSHSSHSSTRPMFEKPSSSPYSRTASKPKVPPLRLRPVLSELSEVELVKFIIECESYYELFGVETTATVEEIRSSFKKLAVTVHPDRNKSAHSNEAFKSTETHSFIASYFWFHEDSLQVLLSLRADPCMGVFKRPRKATRI
jgi:hypothetical protein